MRSKVWSLTKMTAKFVFLLQYKWIRPGANVHVTVEKAYRLRIEFATNEKTCIKIVLRVDSAIQPFEDVINQLGCLEHVDAHNLRVKIVGKFTW